MLQEAIKSKINHNCRSYIKLKNLNTSRWDEVIVKLAREHSEIIHLTTYVYHIDYNLHRIQKPHSHWGPFQFFNNCLNTSSLINAMNSWGKLFHITEPLCINEDKPNLEEFTFGCVTFLFLFNFGCHICYF